VFLPVESCGIIINNVGVKSQGSAIEDICFGGNRDTRAVGYTPQQTQLIRQCTVAKISFEATSAYGGNCSGYTIPANICKEKVPSCVGNKCEYGPNDGYCESPADCAFSYCTQGDDPSDSRFGCEIVEGVDNCPDNPLVGQAITNVVTACCDVICTGGVAEGFEDVTMTDCIGAIDLFNNSDPTFDPVPDLCLLNCDEPDMQSDPPSCDPVPDNCAADSDDCRAASNNNWMNCREALNTSTCPE